jgi:hypothetical protein
MNVVSIGGGVAPGRYALHSRFDHAVNLADGEHLVAVVDGVIGCGPLNLVVSGIDLGRVQTLDVDADAVTLIGRRIPIDPAVRYDPVLPLADVDAERLLWNAELAAALLVQLAPPRSLAFLLDPSLRSEFRPGFEQAVAARIESGVDRLFAGDVAGGIATIKGVGFGLTPSGDDFVAGLLLGLRILEVAAGEDLAEIIAAIRRAARGGNLMANSLVDLAAAGRAPEPMHKLAGALLEGEDAAVDAAVHRIVAVGHTSGADYATGLVMALRAGPGFVSQIAGRM